MKGHTRNSCDRGFGTFKNVIVRKDLFTIDMLADEMNRIANITGEVVDIDSFEMWESLGCSYKKLEGMQKYHIFSFESNRKGHIGCRTRPSDPIEWFDKRKVPVFIPLQKSKQQKKGLSLIKQTDLYGKIRDFVPDQYKDILCPEPDPAVVASVRAERARKSKEKAAATKRRKTM